MAKEKKEARRRFKEMMEAEESKKHASPDRQPFDEPDSFTDIPTHRQNNHLLNTPVVTQNKHKIGENGKVLEPVILSTFDEEKIRQRQEEEKRLQEEEAKRLEEREFERNGQDLVYTMRVRIVVDLDFFYCQ